MLAEGSYDDIPRPHSEQSYEQFLKTFSQRIDFSYRKQFDPFTGSRAGDIITTDGGWGCMIRCAQMLLAQTLLVHTTNTCNSFYPNIQISDRCKQPFFTFCGDVPFSHLSSKVQNEILLIMFEIVIESIDDNKFTPISFDYLETIHIPNVHLVFISKYSTINSLLKPFFVY